MAEQVLKLSRRTQTRYLEVEGTKYEILDPKDLPLEEVLGFQDLGVEVSKAFKDGATKEERRAAFARVREAVRQVVPSLPGSVAMTDLQCIELFNFFLRPARAPERAEASEPVPAAGAPS